MELAPTVLPTGVDGRRRGGREGRAYPLLAVGVDVQRQLELVTDVDLLESLGCERDQPRPRDLGLSGGNSDRDATEDRRNRDA
jgi:hypothetical protein